MARDLSALFAEQQSNIVEWGGAALYGLYEFKSIPPRFTVEFVSARGEPVQGVHIKIRGGTMVVNEVVAKDIVLWRDGAPDQVEVEVRQSKEGSSSVKLWNLWRGAGDVTQAWLGNAAIRVVEDLATGLLSSPAATAKGRLRSMTWSCG